ncbi:MAG: tyrosine-type recombinase/integrase [Nitrospirae bacterium]|nr:tyrosine-type recombinase/integrase [Nitrospirota bacterium]
MDNENKNLSNSDNLPVKEEKQPGQPLYTAGPHIYERIDRYIDLLWQKVKTQERTLDTFFTYKSSLKKFYEFAKERRFPEPAPAFITRFKEHLVSRGLKPSSVNAYLVGVRTFFQFYFEQGMIPINPVKMVKGVRRKGASIHQKAALTIEEARRLLASIIPPPPYKVDRLKEIRDYAMIYLMLKTGLREVEIIRARVEDIKTVEGKKVLFVMGKGDRERSKFVVLDDGVFNGILDYLNARKFSRPEDPLFAKLVLPTKSKWTLGLTTHQVRTVVDFYLYKSGIKSKDSPRPEVTVHSLRHTTANLALDGGAPIVQVQEMMRHAKIETTMVYVKQWNRVKQAAELHIKQI